MQKRDFIQTASIEFLPATQWDVDKSIRYAEKLWDRLSEHGYGDLKKRGERTPAKAYDKLSTNMKAAFDLFWLAFDLKTCSKDKAAAAWLKLGEAPKELVDNIIFGAKKTAAARKNLPLTQTPKHAQGWLNDRDWLGWLTTDTEKADRQQNKEQQALAALKGDIAHAKRMAALPGNAASSFWEEETARLEAKLATLADKTDQPATSYAHT